MADIVELIYADHDWLRKHFFYLDGASTDAQLAATPAQREIGLMFRSEMPQHEGMLFIFEQPSEQCFWMKNTYLPLDIVFIGPDKRIIRIAENAVLWSRQSWKSGNVTFLNFPPLCQVVVRVTIRFGSR